MYVYNLLSKLYIIKAKHTRILYNTKFILLQSHKDTGLFENTENRIHRKRRELRRIRHRPHLGNHPSLV